MIKRRTVFIISVLIAGIFLFPKISLSANNLGVVINEIAWMGTSVSTNSEWLELYNNTDSDINLSGWTLIASDGTPNISLTGTINAHDYFLLERTDDSSVPEVTADQFYVGALGNSGEILELKDASSNLIDLVDSSTGWPAGDNTNKKTMERINSLLGSQVSNWASSQSGGGTPKAINSVFVIPNIKPIALAGSDKNAQVKEVILFDGSGSSDSDGSISNYWWDFGDSTTASGISASHVYNLIGSYLVSLTITDNLGATSSDNLITSVSAVATTTLNINPSDLVINEFVSDPLSGGKEWIEIFNNTTTTINLSGFTLEDGLSTIATLSGEITTNGFQIIELASSKLNNDGDKIILKYNGNIVDQVSYGSWDDGNLSDNAPVTGDPNSIARTIDGQDSGIDNNDFALTITPTKELANIITTLPSTAPAPSSSYSSGNNTANQLNNSIFNYSDVVINEFVSDPDDGEVEWIELYNNTNSAIDLSKWLIEDGSGKKTELAGLISSHQFKVVENPKGNLNNSGDLIVLKDPSAKIIDQVAYGKFDDGNVFDNALLANDPDSIAKIIDGQDTNIDYNDFKITAVLTKGRPNIIGADSNSTTTAQIIITIDKATTTKEFAKIIITEVLPNPDGSDMSEEFIELYNPNNLGVDLSGWLLDDADGGSRPYKINGLVIGSHEYLAFFRKDTGLALNNDTDKARLINPSGKISNEIEYKNIKEGLAYALGNNKWQFTSSPTPGEENEIEIDKIKSANTSNQNKITKITGTVLVEPGILGSQIFYLRDENIQVYSFKKDFPQLSVGDIVEVTGELSEGAGDRRIKTKIQNDIKIIGHQDELLPVEISLSDVDESNQGQLVKIAGEVIEIKGSNIFIDDGTGEAKIYLKSSTGINKSLFKEGEKIELVGIVSKSGSDYRILPRYETDILILGEVKGESAQGEQVKETQGNNKYFIAIIIFMGLIISWLVYKQYGHKLK